MGAVVVTPWEVPGKLFNIRLVSINEVNYKDWRILTDHPRFVGEYVAAVAAPSEEAAQRALEALRVKWRVLPHVLSAEEALADDAPRLYDEILFGSEKIRPSGNIACTRNTWRAAPTRPLRKQTWL